MNDNDRRGIITGREKRVMKPERKRKRRFTESFVFTAGLAFVVIYIVGMLATSGGERIKYDDTGDAVAVFAPTEERDSDESDRGFWDLLDDCLERAFSKGDGEK